MMRLGSPGTKGFEIWIWIWVDLDIFGYIFKMRLFFVCEFEDDVASSMHVAQLWSWV